MQSLIASESSACTPARRAVTMIEVLVVIAIVGVLLALLTPALLHARTAGKDAVSLVRLKQNAVSLHLYSSSHSDSLPAGKQTLEFQSDGLPGVVIESSSDSPGEVRRWLGTTWFNQASYWHLLLYAAGFEPTEAWHSPSRTLTDQGRSSDSALPTLIALTPSDFKYSHSFLAQPDHWRRDGVQDVSQWGSVRLSAAQSPSLKVALFESIDTVLSRHPRADRLGTPRPLVFLDGHAATRAPRDATPPVPNRFLDGAALFLHGTENGVLGRDY